MRYLIYFFILSILTPLSANKADVFHKIEKELDSIIVKDLSSNKTIFKKNEEKLVRPASLTKIMTSILAIESGKMNDVVTITKPMIDVEPTKLGLQVGDKVRLGDLVHVALIRSANDAAYSIAYYLGGGSKDTFVEMMNKKAKTLGMKHTNFSNPAGFDTPNHKSTAFDLMKLTEYTIKNTTFNKIVNLNTYSFSTLNTNRKFQVYTSNKLKRANKYVVGVKTGYTNEAGACLIARGKKGEKDVLLVMLNAENRWVNAKKALDELVNVKKGDTIKQKKGHV
ncbi:MAG: serine hydrolase [Sulfurimonas sp.]|uniref:D-alanyl-D-alanine carboxypeptidase family protein n=1 Tax=Sulfurimonas sp. TaxID=2022749 RepID=UPI00261B4168|nr:serine hydrolase [Sulfurimonas sp.]MDD2653116.1 serine hydrolase [Sulfurimonas sp.]MDD3451357.1 serine hydrolase [Sulfurimonas sp.]